MSAFMRFPGFKTKAFTLSYDDGTRSDIRLAKLVNDYKLACTFNVFSFRDPCDSVSGRISEEEALKTYTGDNIEVAIHCDKHLTLTEVAPAAAVRDVLVNRERLEKLFKKPITGLAYPCGAYDDNVVSMLKSCGIDYARTIRATEGFSLPTDWLRMPVTCHHNNPRLFELADKFLANDVHPYFWRNKPQLFYVWGHSSEFEKEEDWQRFESFLAKMSGNDNVWYATNIDIFKYVRAFNRLVFSADLEYVENPSAIDVYIKVLRDQLVVPAGKTVAIRQQS